MSEPAPDFATAFARLERTLLALIGAPAAEVPA